MTQRTIEIGGMNCGHCVGRVRSALTALPGVTVDAIRVGQATLTFDETATNAGAVEQAIEDAGYRVLQTR